MNTWDRIPLIYKCFRGGFKAVIVCYFICADTLIPWTLSEGLKCARYKSVVNYRETNFILIILSSAKQSSIRQYFKYIFTAKLCIIFSTKFLFLYCYIIGYISLESISQLLNILICKKFQSISLIWNQSPEKWFP